MLGKLNGNSAGFGAKESKLKESKNLEAQILRLLDS